MRMAKDAHEPEGRAPLGTCMSLELVEWAASWPLVLPYFDGRVPAGFLSPAEDYLETPLDLTEYLIENKAATFMMRLDEGRGHPGRGSPGGRPHGQAGHRSPRWTTGWEELPVVHATEPESLVS